MKNNASLCHYFENDDAKETNGGPKGLKREKAN
jgi:hypothetical protein